MTGRFANVGRSRIADIFDGCYNAYDGRDGGEHLLMCKSDIRGGLFFETADAWPGVWTHNASCGMYGWEPFLLPEDSLAHRRSIELLLGVQRHDGLFPESAIPAEGVAKIEKNNGTQISRKPGCVQNDAGDVGMFYNDSQLHGDVFIDGHCMALIMICEHMLWTRDESWIDKYFKNIKLAVEYLLGRERKDGMLLVKSGGAVFEQCYGYTGFPSSTQIFACAGVLRAYEVSKLMHQEQPAWNVFADELSTAVMKNLYTPKGFFASAMDERGQLRGYLDYFESFPNVFAGPLGVVGLREVLGIVGRIAEIPEVDMFTPICSCYPGRPGYDIHYSHGGPGYHMNGGAWMGWGGLDVWTHLQAGKYKRAEYLINNLIEMQKHKTLMDRVEEFGKDRDAKTGTMGCSHPLRASAGGFGNILRGFFDLKIYADRLEYRPLFLKGTGQVQTNIPVRWGDKEILFDLHEDTDSFFLPVRTLKFDEMNRDKIVIVDEVAKESICT